MNESARTTLRTASKVGAVVAAGAYAKGETQFAEKAGAASLGGLYTTQDRDYETEVIFNCNDRFHDKPGSPKSERLW